MSQLTFYFLLLLFNVSVLEVENFDNQPKMSISLFLFLKRDFYCPYKLQKYVTCCVYFSFFDDFLAMFIQDAFSDIFTFSHTGVSISFYTKETVSHCLVGIFIGLSIFSN